MLRDTCPELAGSDEQWRVRLQSGDVTMTLDQLDAAFEAGHIDVDTLVCAPGAYTFTRLGEAAGLDEEAPAPAAVPTPMTSVSPMVLSDEPSFARLPVPSLDLGESPFGKPRFSKKLLAIPAGLAVIAAMIGIAASASASSSAIAAAGASNELVAPSVVTPSAPPAPPAPVAAPAETAPAAPVLTDAQKKALSAKDKKAEAAAAAKAKQRASTAPKRVPGAKGKSSAPFSKGGSPHDPLNGAI